MGMLTGPRATRESETTRKSKQFQPSSQKGRNLRARASRFRHAVRLRNICRNAGAVQHLLQCGNAAPSATHAFSCDSCDAAIGAASSRFCSVGAASSRFAASVRRRRDPAAQRPPTDNDSENRVLPAGRDRNRSASESGRGQPQSTMEPPPAIRRRRRANRCPPWNRRLRFDGIPITPAAIPRCETTPPESFARPCAGPRSTRSRAPAFVPVAMKLVRVCARAPAGPRQLAAQV